ncbi:MAG: cellulase family glycosylhydrolase [Armatimonadota bacterium]|nr:glycoside hydrolase family 5 protein [bacterium]
MRTVFALIAAVFALVICGPTHADGFVKANGSSLTLNGKPYRAMGANAPDLFSAYAGLGIKPEEKAARRQSMIDSILDAEKSKIAFFRFWATGFWPKDMQLYFDNPDQYWKSMDEVMSLCRRHHIKVVPSIFWNIVMWPMACEEDQSAIIDPNSKTYKAMHKYAKEIVTRYKDDTNVLMWELYNEGFLGADVQAEGRDAPPAEVYLPNPKLIKQKWTKADSLSTPIIRQFYVEMTKYIKSIDPNHLVESGDAGVRDCSKSLRESFPEQVWVRDTLRDHIASLLASQPEPLDVFCQHLYGSGSGKVDWQIVNNMTILDYNRYLIRAAEATRTPMYVGEFGQTNPSFKEDPKALYTRQFIDVMDKEGVALASVWAWHFPWQPENNVTSKTHPLLVKRITEFNKKYAGM